jgi:hypothetical protein
MAGTDWDGLDHHKFNTQIEIDNYMDTPKVKKNRLLGSRKHDDNGPKLHSECGYTIQKNVLALSVKRFVVIDSA